MTTASDPYGGIVITRTVVSLALRSGLCGFAAATTIDGAARVTGIGGVFFKAQNPEKLRTWYRGASWHRCRCDWRQLSLARDGRLGRNRSYGVVDLRGEHRLLRPRRAAADHHIPGSMTWMRFSHGCVSRESGKSAASSRCRDAFEACQSLGARKFGAEQNPARSRDQERFRRCCSAGCWLRHHRRPFRKGLVLIIE